METGEAESGASRRLVQLTRLDRGYLQWSAVLQSPAKSRAVAPFRYGQPSQIPLFLGAAILDPATGACFDGAR